VPPGPYGEAHLASDNFMTTFGLTAFGAIISKDRPIGISLRGSGFELPRRALALTREQIETILTPRSTSSSSTDPAALNQLLDQKNTLWQSLAFITADEETSAGSGPGGSGIPLIDGPGPNLNGNYRLSLHVERVP
jgi:hypothetical protein